MASVYLDLPLRSVGSISAPGIASETTLQALLDELELKADLTETQPVEFGARVPSFQEITNLTTVAQTFTAPADAKWVKVSAGGQNTAPIRYKIGGTATATSGIRLEQSRTEDNDVAGDVSVIAESGSNQYVCVIFGT
jgi:hypothetical protein